MGKTKIVIEMPTMLYLTLKLDGVWGYPRLTEIIRNGTPLESYLPSERCDTCKYVDCSIDNEPCINCKVPHKSFYEPKTGIGG